MATTTPNFGWPVPTSTDLVKDGATAIEALGDSIDASLLDLKGGTTGQVLSKASGTDMDFTWIAQDDSNAIQNAIVDAKGDLIAASAADTPARLAVGNNGEILVADSSTSTGLRYTAGTVQANPVINSAYQIWQRGTSFSAAAYSAQTYLADRWWALAGGSSSHTVARQATGDTTNLPNIQYCTRIQRVAGNTQTTNINWAQDFETINSIPYAGKTITFSFYARAGANYSGTSLSYQVRSGTGTDQSMASGYTGSSSFINSSAALTTTWQRFSATAAVSSLATQLGVLFFNTPSGTAGAADYWEVTGVQIDIGSVALPFRTYAGTIQGELAACQRYYNGNTFAFRNTSGVGTGLAAAFTTYLPQMRSTPTLAFTAAASASNNISGTPTLDVLQSDTATWIARLNYNSNGSSSDTFYVRAFSASSEL